jgi:hypothetical protein
MVERAVRRRAGEVPAEGTTLMHDLIPLGATLPGALTTAEIDATVRFAEAEKAPATRAAYASDWRDFAAWCALRGATALPAHQGIVAAYLSAMADEGRRASTIGRRAAAIAYHHKIAGHEPPTNAEGVKAVLRGIRRTIGSAKQGKAPATADLLMQMVALCPDSMIGRRDRALLCLGFAGAFRRSELCALQVDDLVEVPDGLRILIRRSKGGSGRAGAGGRDTARLQAPPGRGGADMAGGSGDQRRAGVPSGGAGRSGLAESPGRRQRGPDREAVCTTGWPRSCVLCRPQPALGLPDQRGGGGGVAVQADRGEPGFTNALARAATSAAASRHAGSRSAARAVLTARRTRPSLPGGVRASSRPPPTSPASAAFFGI